MLFSNIIMLKRSLEGVASFNRATVNLISLNVETSLTLALLKALITVLKIAIAEIALLLYRSV